jgi:thiamine-monophosphate kinase
MKFGRKKFQYLKIYLSYLTKNNYKKSNFISNGDDYQILFTASTDKSRIISNTAKKLSVKISRIGKIRPNNQKITLYW